jgi:aryl-alcohol dehydrogenase-like predicted oxidoreductase
VLDACRELGITLIAYQPLGDGRAHREVSAGGPAQGDSALRPLLRGYGLKQAQPVLALLGEIGEGYSKTPAQVALRWLMEQEGVLPVPVPRTGGRRPAMPKRCPSRWLLPRSRRSTERRRRGGDED